MINAFGVVKVMEIIPLKVLIEYVWRILIPLTCKLMVVGIYCGQLKLLQMLKIFFGVFVEIVFGPGSVYGLKEWNVHQYVLCVMWRNRILSMSFSIVLVVKMCGACLFSLKWYPALLSVIMMLRL
jgi:hypothetical protein